MHDLRTRLAAWADELGFSQLRVTTSDVDIQRYDAWIAASHHASMTWLANGRSERAEPGRLLSGVRSVAVLAFDYASVVPPDPGPRFGRVAAYAWGRDYHNVVGKRLRRLQRRLDREGIDSYASVDFRPVWERWFAARAGLGWAARNACAVQPGEGSSFVLACLLLAAELAPDPPMEDHCGRCVRCVEACPTGAIVAPGVVDARRCISYLTIEHDGPVADALASAMGSWVFGCDDCRTVCPHERPREGAFQNAWLDLPELLDTPDAALVARFEGSPIRRATPHRLKRNAAIVLGNRGCREGVPALERAMRDRGVVAEAAAWARERVG
jgi:epoxyqueuosine reductase